jgi:hypothetical protein
MDELIDQPASKAGIDNVVAEKSIELMLGLLRSGGPYDKVQALIDRSSGTEAAIAAASTDGGHSRLMDNGTGEIQSVAGELFKFSRDKIGAD